MPKSFSSATKRILNTINSSEVLICLFTITHPQLGSPLRITSDPTQVITAGTTTTNPVYGTISNGTTYLYIGALDIILPMEDEEAPPSAKLQISNVSLELINMIRSVAEPNPAVTIQLCFASNTNNIVMTLPNFLIQQSEYDSDTAAFPLVIDTDHNLAFPKDILSPTRFPSIFVT